MVYAKFPLLKQCSNILILDEWDNENENKALFQYQNMTSQ